MQEERKLPISLDIGRAFNFGLIIKQLNEPIILTYLPAIKILVNQLEKNKKDRGLPR